GQACPLRLWTQKQGQAIRLEVISPEAVCGKKGVTVYDGYQTSARGLGKLCDHDVIRGSSHNMVLSPVDEYRTSPVFLKLSALSE
ncbi:hypothetical protein PoB_005760700, partial [Plakobranchus ocellatus]